MITEKVSFPNGMTVRELKALVKDMPETNIYGDEAEVWFTDKDGYSNQIKSVWPLNEIDISLEIQ